MAHPQIFENYTFWVAQRVPRRANIVETIKLNGGKHTRVEKNADFLIADASRSDAPKGAYSHELILDSSEKGSFQITDRYRIRGAEGPAKAMRTPFSHEEDCALAKFVLEHYEGHRGNKLYQEFAERWPSHPWQSWRDRWVKRLVNMPRGKLEDMVREAEAGQEERPRSVTPPAQAQPTAQSSHESAPDEDQANQADGNASGAEDQDEMEDKDQDLDDEELATRAQNHFYLELSDFTERHGLTGQIHPFHTIGDVEFGLWDVFMAYADQEVEPDRLQIGAVADYLGLDGSDAAVVTELSVIWEQNLLEFVRQRALQAETDDQEEDEDADDEAHRSQPYETAPQSPPILPPQESLPVDLQSSPPQPQPQATAGSSQAKASRSSPQKRTQYQSQVLPSRKRRRLAPDAEIPSTPDEVLGVIRPSIEEKGDGPEEGGQTPSQKLSSSVQRRLFGQVEVKDSQEDSQAAFTQAQNKTPRRTAQKAKEPLVLQTQTTVVDVSPSQQLQTELASSSASKRAAASRREEMRNGSRRDSSPTPKEVVPRTQVSTQTRTPNPSKSPSKTESPTKIKTLPKVDVPRAVVPPKRKLPSTFAKDSQIQTRAPASEPRSKAPTPLSASTRRSETATSSHHPAQHQPSINLRPPLDDYDPDSQDPLNEPPARPKLTSGLSTLEDWIAHYQTLGYPRKLVTVALKATTMTPGGQAAHTMESIKRGGGIPSNYEGVWTDRDDRGLAAVDNLERELGEELYVPEGAKFNVKGKGTLDRRGRMRKEKARLLDKHGRERLKLRLRFLEAERGHDGVA